MTDTEIIDLLDDIIKEKKQRPFMLFNPRFSGRTEWTLDVHGTNPYRIGAPSFRELIERFKEKEDQ